MKYDNKQIAWELEQIALGNSYYGNALRVAKDIPGMTADDRSLLDRYATGLNSGIDHVGLQVIAIRIAKGDVLTCELDEVRAELEAARKDAERITLATDLRGGRCACEWKGDKLKVVCIAHLDAVRAFDAAMKKSPLNPLLEEVKYGLES